MYVQICSFESRGRCLSYFLLAIFAGNVSAVLLYVFMQVESLIFTLCAKVQLSFIIDPRKCNLYLYPRVRGDWSCSCPSSSCWCRSRCSSRYPTPIDGYWHTRHRRVITDEPSIHLSHLLANHFTPAIHCLPDNRESSSDEEAASHSRHA